MSENLAKPVAYFVGQAAVFPAFCRISLVPVFRYLLCSYLAGGAGPPSPHRHTAANTRPNYGIPANTGPLEIHKYRIFGPKPYFRTLLWPVDVVVVWCGGWV